LTTNSNSNRRRMGMSMSIINLAAGVTGFFYQFMADGTFLTFLVCMSALVGLVENRKEMDERDAQLLDQSYSSAFMYLFFAIVLIFLFQLFFGKLQFVVPIINAMNAHWVGIMASVMCVMIGITGIRNYRDIK